MLTVLSALSLAQIIAPRPGVPVIPPTEIRRSPAAPIQPPPTIPQLPLNPRPIEGPIEIVQGQEVRPLPGQLDDTPVFNSNSPELIQTEGILLSTFSPTGMRSPAAHLNYPFQGRFDIFAHHIARGTTPDDVRTLYVGILIANPSRQPVKIEIGQGASYLSQEAPFLDLPAYVANPMGTVFAGPGSRTTNDVLRGQRQTHWPTQITIPPGGTYLLANVPIPLRRLTVATNGTLPPGYIIPGLPAPPAASEEAQTDPEGNPVARPLATGISTNNAAAVSRPPVRDNRPLPSNGRTILMQLNSNGPVYVASLAMYAPQITRGVERVPTQVEWENLLRNGTFAGPRDRIPTPPNSRSFTRFFYGRVAGVSQGTQWTATATDNSSVDYLSIPQPGRAFSYVLSTVDRNTFGTGQIQSAPMLVRYPDTAYRAHGNYGVQYNVTLPLQNNTDTTQQVAVMMQTPMQDERQRDGLRFRNPPYDQIFFRGTVRIRFINDFGIPQTRYMHLVQRRGQEGQPLIRMTVPRGARRQVELQFIYPPDATPPQVVTVRTIENRSVADAAPSTTP
ncbi:DUF3370 domain-containing protein [Leptolyngbya sp. FACHB-711]|uniref:DUF3370 domain-containing protein n=1 Tax=unclassified Leptolyngbya TaxID=2650499 RepID=UPI001685BB19|nr:DUF3370 domain-containing protein [Leptolyngbya sp. FACHB-711]MBD1853841.1 DUF3370 domain-containing protein [Cyanobacteria bacterium FACHB-502]MBD2026188.1 DUF3370 domain-containing protein [Leptolyngbya sp. FACHB-711]